MTSLSARFREFFGAVNGGAAPYPWQCALAEEVAATGRWPDIAAPTGAGKSSVVEVHVFLAVECALGLLNARPPRRLILVAPRRVLVDDQYDRAWQIRLHLGHDSGDNAAIARAAGALARLRTSGLASNEPRDSLLADSPLGVWKMRGGIRQDFGWRLEPAMCQIICATPQMWGSRLLFRGYGATTRSRNLESGLLAHDAVAIIDEAHLHQRLIDTGRRLATMDRTDTALQVVSMTATGRPGAARQMTLTDADLADSRMQRRIGASKQIMVVEADDLARDAEAAIVVAAQAAAGGGTVGVFVNDVPTSLKIAAALGKDGSSVELVCGRMRPADLEALREQRPGLLTSAGDQEIDYLVSTQSLEVGVDLDLPGMVTMIAPPSALAQRAGRLNRSGSREESTFTVISHHSLGKNEPDAWPRSGPYTGAELAAGAKWLQGLQGSISPSNVMLVGVPVRDPPLLPAIRRVDLETLELTSDPQASDPDPDLYLAEPQAADRDIGLVARRHLDLDDDVVEDMLRACPPRAHEIAPVPIPDERRLARIVDAAAGRAWVVRSTADEVQVGLLGQDPFLGRLSPGDLVIVPDGTPLCTGRVVNLDASPRSAAPLHDVLSRPSEEDGRSRQMTPRRRDEIVELAPAAMMSVLAIDPTLASRAGRRALAEVLTGTGQDQLAADIRATRRLAELQLHWSGGVDAASGLLLVSHMGAQAAESPDFAGDEVVLLSDHLGEVAQRVRLILERLGAPISDRERVALIAAARVHDAGKAHPRFQARMGACPGDDVVAKPRPGHHPDKGDGWRHEQLSAAFASNENDRDALVISLVGAHHGCGRALFDRNADALCAGWDVCPPPIVREASWLFGASGTYEQLRIQARREVGVFRLAWLEALLRCADMQVSREGL